MCRNLCRVFAVVGICLALATASLAEVVTWTGSSGTSYTDGGNWDTGSVPANSDWTDIARFTENSPANKSPHLPSNREIRGLEFIDSTGWNFSGSQITARYLTSTGAGTNTISARVKSDYSNYTWTVGEGNTLDLAGGLYQDSGGSTIVLDGGGMAVLPSRIDSWSNSLKMHIEDALLRIEDSVPYAKSGCAAFLQSPEALLQLETSVSAATALLGSRIIDGVGNGLSVTDLGGGFVEIASISQPVDVPEPASFWLAALGLAGMGASRRRRSAR